VTYKELFEARIGGTSMTLDKTIAKLTNWQSMSMTQLADTIHELSTQWSQMKETPEFVITDKNSLKDAIATLAESYLSTNAKLDVGDIVFYGEYSNKFGRVVGRSLNSIDLDYIGSIYYNIQRINQQGQDIKVRLEKLEESTLNPSSLTQIAAIVVPHVVLQGWLSLKENCEDEWGVCLTADEYRDRSFDDEEAIAEQFSNLIYRYGDILTVRYWVSDRELESVNDAAEAYLASYYGHAEADYSMSYSEITGYLYTTEELMVGGHDLLEELKSYVGRYLLMEVVAS
jgi:hypothetical protein